MDAATIQACINIVDSHRAVPCEWMANAVVADMTALLLKQDSPPDLEALRQENVAGCEAILNHPLLTTPRQKALAKANVLFWESATTEELQRLSDAL